MNFTFLATYLVLDLLGFFSNLLTVIYIFKSFEIKTHVFALIFLDSVISFLCSGISIILDLLLFSGYFHPACRITFFTIYLPGCYGAVLTFLITSVRLYLAKKSAKNMHPSNKKVLSCALSLFTLIAGFYTGFFVICTIMDVPYSLFADSCMNPNQEPRMQSRPALFVINSPNFFNIFSLITDLRMLRFLKQTILPASNIAMDLRTPTHEGNN